MDERVKFIARLLDGEAISRLCEEFEISRKTGYKILQRRRAGVAERFVTLFPQPSRSSGTPERLHFRATQRRPSSSSSALASSRSAVANPSVNRP